MKSFGKRLAVLIVVLCLAVSGAIIGVIGSKALEPEPDFTIMVMSDVHVFEEAHVGDLCDDFLAFDALRTGRVQYLSECIFRNAVDKVIDTKPDALLIPGDIVDVATVSTHKKIADYLKAVEDAGIDVYVVPGNHDTASKSPSFENGYQEYVEAADYDKFAEIYADFGYNEAVDRHDNSISYATDMGENYRVISIDATRAKANPDKLSDDLIEWAVNAVEQAIADGKTPIGLTHYSLISHYGEILSNFTNEKAYINDAINFRSQLMEAGLEYVFTGHMHASDIVSYTDKTGRTLYDIETASLPAFPSPIRKIDVFGEEFHFNSIFLEALKEDTLPDYLPAEERAEILANYQDYANKYLAVDMMDNVTTGNKLGGYVDMLIGAFDIDTSSAGAKKLNDDFVNTIVDLVEAPIYDKDAKANETTVESICRKYNVTLPVVEGYTTVGDYIFGFVGKWFKGDEKVELGSDEDLLLRYCIYSALDVVAEFDLFGRLHELQPNVHVVDLTQSMPLLFSEGKLDVVNNNLLSNVFKSVPMIKDNSMLSGLINMPSAEIMSTVANLLGMIDLFGLDLTYVIDGANGALSFTAIFELAMGDVGTGIINDFSLPDNNVVLPIVEEE
ncbi:MAG: metallophosphoesterase [Clostridia bacterium]|nr:metallophosphoesterase [Clostridia bacterium]